MAKVSFLLRLVWPTHCSFGLKKNQLKWFGHVIGLNPMEGHISHHPRATILGLLPLKPGRKHFMKCEIYFGLRDFSTSRLLLRRFSYLDSMALSTDRGQ